VEQRAELKKLEDVNDKKGIQKVNFGSRLKVAYSSKLNEKWQKIKLELETQNGPNASCRLLIDKTHNCFWWQPDGVFLLNGKTHCCYYDGGTGFISANKILIPQQAIMPPFTTVPC
jgi:hypothetical protein